MKLEIRSAIVPIIIVNVLFFAIQVFSETFTDLLILNSKLVFLQPWRLVSSMFLHGSPSHLLFNMYALFIFGPMLEERIGVKRFMLLFFGSGLLAGWLSSFFYSLALGASGAIMGVIGMLIILMPELKLLLFFAIPAPLWMAGIIYAAMDIFGIFFPSGVGNIAHLVGMAFGLVYGFLLKKQSKKFHKKFESKKHLEENDIDEYLRSGRI